MFQTESYKGRDITCIEFHTNMNDREKYAEEWTSIRRILANSLDELIEKAEREALSRIFGGGCKERVSETLIAKADDRYELQIFFSNTNGLGDVCAFICFEATHGEEIEADLEI